MTRAVVILAVVLAATSLGLFAQDSSGRPATAPNAASARASAQSSAEAPGSQQGTPINANEPSAVTPDASAQAAPAEAAAATSALDRATEKPVSPPPNSASQDNPNAQRLQTSLLPLLGLIGLGSLVAGLFARR